MNNIIKDMVNTMGGIRAAAMVGGIFMTDEENNTVTFKFKGSRQAHAVRMVLNSMDLYDLTFIKTTNYGMDTKTVATFENVYNDMVKNIIEKTTGLYLSL